MGAAPASSCGDKPLPLRLARALCFACGVPHHVISAAATPPSAATPLPPPRLLATTQRRAPPSSLTASAGGGHTPIVPALRHITLLSSSSPTRCNRSPLLRLSHAFRRSRDGAYRRRRQRPQREAESAVSATAYCRAMTRRRRCRALHRSPHLRLSHAIQQTRNGAYRHRRQRPQREVECADRATARCRATTPRCHRHYHIVPPGADRDTIPPTATRHHPATQLIIPSLPRQQGVVLWA